MKTLAIIAHDRKKDDVLAWASANEARLRQYNLVATGTTGGLLHDIVGLDVQRMLSGPMGGDAQIGAMVVEAKIDGVIFIVDPLDKHPHEPDIQALLRLCNVTNTPLGTNLATADLILASLLPD